MQTHYRNNKEIFIRAVTLIQPYTTEDLRDDLIQYIDDNLSGLDPKEEPDLVDAYNVKSNQIKSMSDDQLESLFAYNVEDMSQQIEDAVYHIVEGL